jgi:YD repeat-containing protein
LVEATVFTQTTRFRYNGLGARIAVEVVGHGATTYALDYAAGNVQMPRGHLPSRNARGVSARILAETTPTSIVSYLYGHECLGEQRDDEWLYYLHDAEGYVRQGADADGAIVSTWLFDPDGTVLEGPDGPVSEGIRAASSPGLRRGLRWVDGADLPRRPVLRSDAGDLVGAHAAAGDAWPSPSPARRAPVGAAAVPGAVRGGVAGGVWRQWKHRNSQSYLYKYSLSNPVSY